MAAAMAGEEGDRGAFGGFGDCDGGGGGAPGGYGVYFGYTGEVSEGVESCSADNAQDYGFWVLVRDERSFGNTVEVIWERLSSHLDEEEKGLKCSVDPMVLFF